MKKSELQEIIREEISKVLNEENPQFIKENSNNKAKERFDKIISRGTPIDEKDLPEFKGSTWSRVFGTAHRDPKSKTGYTTLSKIASEDFKRFFIMSGPAKWNSVMAWGMQGPVFQTWEVPEKVYRLISNLQHIDDYLDDYYYK